MRAFRGTVVGAAVGLIPHILAPRGTEGERYHQVQKWGTLDVPSWDRPGERQLSRRRGRL